MAGGLPVPDLPAGVAGARIARTVVRVHAWPLRWVLRRGSAADGQGTAASFSARVIRARLCPASRWVNIQPTTGAVCGYGSSRRARRPQAACALFGCGPTHQPARTRREDRPPRYRPCSRARAAIAVSTRILVRVISRFDCRPSATIACS